MTYLAPRLRHRIQIQTGVDVANDEGGFDRSYETQLTIWAAVKTKSEYIEAIRGQQQTVEDDEIGTHEFLVRAIAVDDLGREFTKAFSTAFDRIASLNPLKSDWYIFVEKGETYKGRRFRIKGIKRDERFNEFIRINAEEIEEEGTGWP